MPLGSVGFVNVARGSNYGYSSGYGAIIYGATSGSVTPCFNVDPVANPSGSFTGNGGDVMFRNYVQFISPNSSNNGYNFYFTLQDGYLQANNSLRSPIFYDSNDTTYYVNPNDTSTSAVFAGNISMNGVIIRRSAGTGYLSGNYASSETTTTTGAIYTIGGSYYPTSSGLNTMYGIGYTYASVVGGAAAYTGASAWGMYTSSSGTCRVFLDADNGRVLATGDMRAPTYYDSNDTGYYTDPNGTSRMGDIYTNRIGVGQAINASWPLIVNGNAYLNGGGYGQAEGSWRAPLFYDSNDTSYYVDPANISITNRMGANYFQYNGAVSTDNTFGLYFDSGLSSAYAIYRQSGAWSHPYPDLRIAFHTGIQIGANSGYQGVRFYTDYDMSSQVMSVNNGSDPLGGGNVYVNGSLQAGSSLRAPIFYDSDNTGYYTDPASTSNLNVVAVQRAYAGYDAGVTNSFSCSDWFRSNGSTGWYNASYTGGIYMEDSTWVRVYNSKAFYVGNAIAATGNITAYYSDERLKTKISGIENAIEKVRKLNGFYYIENDLAESFGYNNKNKQVALSAQSVQSVLPEAVSLAPFDIQTDEFTGEITSKTGENYLTVDYSRLVPLLVEAIKEQDREAVELRARVAMLESLISKLIDV